MGFLVHGTIDLDNIDNVTRACLHLGIDIKCRLPLEIVDWLAQQKHAPTDIEQIKDERIVLWLKYREDLYRRFFLSSDEELGRQAFLQHLMRIAIKTEYPRKSLIWNTDDGLLLSFANREKEGVRRLSLSQLAMRYMLMESPIKVAHIDIENKDDLRVLHLPKAVEWIEEQFCTSGFEAMVLVSCKRYNERFFKESLLPAPAGSLFIFKLGQELKQKSLPKWLRDGIPASSTRRQISQKISQAIKEKTKIWLKEKPWRKITPKYKESIIDNLTHVGNWSFSLSRNDNLHPYPSTFVYAIPANLINSLRLQGELIIDPFGGIGQTAVEAIKYGCKTISADSNSLACLFASTKLSFLSPEIRQMLRNLSKEQFSKHQPCIPPKVDNISKWFHDHTLEELCKIWRYISYQRNDLVKQFLTVCFSAILPSCTARKGKHHTYFADNTPLPAGLVMPPYENAFELFLGKVINNIDVLERLYAFIERNRQNPEDELLRAQILQLDATKAVPADYGIEPHSVAAIITSPPYLCMADYSFGLRLSYYWIDPDALGKDFDIELGARRLRKSPKSAIESYLEGIRAFAKNSANLIRPNGFLATVFGAPVARAFKDIDVFGEFDSTLQNEGFDLIWQHNRSIHHRRGHGCIETERVAVHIFNA